MPPKYRAVAISAPESELVGCPEAAAVVLVMMCRLIAFAFACKSGNEMRVDTGFYLAMVQVGLGRQSSELVDVEDMTFRARRHIKKKSPGRCNFGRGGMGRSKVAGFMLAVVCHSHRRGLGTQRLPIG
jgi:hypothetical protein